MEDGAVYLVRNGAREQSLVTELAMRERQHLKAHPKVLWP